ncbi:MAG: chorismate synthase [Deltaproteobacteria bacterium]|nr:chorismate synthase [Deltaproteobacteria bacterium]
MSLRYLTAGESHGPGLTAILEGLPSGLSVTVDLINEQLARRQMGYGRGGRMKIETDKVEITAGVRHGMTLGSPIALWVANRDWKNWAEEMSVAPGDFNLKRQVTSPRPGHADLAGGLKYDHRDLRNILERASARETTVRVAVGAICRRLMTEFGVKIAGHVTTIGGVDTTLSELPPPDEIAKRSEADPVRCIDPEASKRMIAKIDEVKKKGDTVGGIFEVIISNLPPGLGSHVQWDSKLDGRLAQAILSIQAIKGVEFGAGFGEGRRPGSEAHDEIFYDDQNRRFYRKTNRAGGLEGGMTNGEPIIIRAVMKPISTLYRPLHSVDIETKKELSASVERSDTCAVPAASVIAENVAAFEIARAFLEKFGGDSLREVRRNYEGYLEQVRNY